MGVVMVNMIEVGIRRGHIEIVAHVFFGCGCVVVVELQQGVCVVGQVEVGDGAICDHRVAGQVQTLEILLEEVGT